MDDGGTTERQWFYAVGGKDRHGPIPETQIRDLIAQGQISAADLLWTEGMPAWAPLDALPEFQAPQPASPAATGGRARPPAGLSSWMTFVGVLGLFSGALTCLTCVGLPIGVLMIVAGVAALEGAGQVREMQDADPAVAPLLAKFKTYFLATGWVFILHLILMGVLLVTSAGAIFAVLARAAHSFD